MNDFIIENGILTKYQGPGGDVVIPDGVTRIDSFAFSDCTCLTSITIPDGVASIGDSAFSGCSGLKNVTIPNSVTSIGNYAFFWCSSLLCVTLPNNMTKINSNTFCGCGSLADVTIPNRVKRIGENAFSGCKSLTSVTIPRSVTSIGENAFSGCKSLTSVTIPRSVTSIGEKAFSGCINLTSVTISANATSIGDGAFADCGLMTVTLGNADVKVPKGAFPAYVKFLYPPEVLAHFALFGPEQSMIKKIAGDNTDAAVQRIANILREEETAARLGSAAVKFTLSYLPDVEPETLRALAAVLEEKKCTAALKKLRTDPAAAAKLDEKGTEREHPLEMLVQKNRVDDDVTKKLQKVVGSGVRYAGTDEISSPEAVVFVIAAYARQVPDYRNGYVTMLFRTDAKADKAAAYLDRNELLALLERIVYEQDEPQGIAALARYGGEKQITELLKAAKGWPTGRTKVVDGALMLSDTHAAMLYMEKKGRLDVYASLRGMDEETLRDTVLTDFGLDETGKKVYDLGKKTFSVVVGKEFHISLWDNGTNTAVRTLPKKGADPAKYAAASEDLSNLRKNVKKVAKARCDMVLGDFLSGDTHEADKWRNAYLTNPVLRRVAELLVWNQGANAFTLGTDGPIKSDGTAYTVTDEPIAVAHPMEMDPTEVAAWQQYFVANGLKQPFEQVWEPVIDPGTIRADRYEGCIVSEKVFMNRKKHGIERFSYLDENYEYQYDYRLTQCKLERGYGKEGEFVLGRFSFDIYNRQVNHIVALLDRWTVAERILKDDITVQDALRWFTAAQIMEYIRLASENACPNCAAMLLEYKQAHYPDFDPMVEFTLE